MSGVIDFEEQINWKIYNEKNMEDYHRKYSAYYYIEQIQVPTLIFYCEDDQIVDRYSVGVEFE